MTCITTHISDMQGLFSCMYSIIRSGSLEYDSLYFSQAEAMPAAAHSTGLNLIGQLGSGDSGSSSESEDSSSDSSGDSMGLAR